MKLTEVTYFKSLQRWRSCHRVSFGNQIHKGEGKEDLLETCFQGFGLTFMQSFLKVPLL